MSSIKIQSLPEDDSLNNSDVFLKSSLINEAGTPTYQAKGGIGSEFGILSGIKGGINSNNINLNFLNTSSTTADTLSFNTLNSNNGIVTSLTNNLINISLDKSNIITNQMLSGVLVTTPKISDQNVTLQKLESSVQTTLNKLQSLIFRFNSSDVAKAWINFNGYVNTGVMGTTKANYFIGTLVDGSAFLDQNSIVKISKNSTRNFITNSVPFDNSLIGVTFTLKFGKIIQGGGFLIPKITNYFVPFSKKYLFSSPITTEIIKNAVYLSEIQIRIIGIDNSNGYYAFFKIIDPLFALKDYIFSGAYDKTAKYPINSGPNLSSAGIRSSYNIKDLVRDSVGNYTFYFKNPTTDPYYTVVVGGSQWDGLHNYDSQLKLVSQNVNGFTMRSHDYNSDSPCDITYGNVLVFGN